MRPWRDTDFSARGGGKNRSGFTLVELLVSMTVVALMVVFLGQLLNRAMDTWNRGEGNKERLQNVRAVADFIGNELSAALLPVNRTDTTNLQFVVNPTTPAGLSTPTGTYNNRDMIFWQAPLATEQSLGDVAEIGYFVQWDTSNAANPRAQLCRFFANPTVPTSSTNPSPSPNANFLIYPNPPANPPPPWLTATIISAVAPGTYSSTPNLAYQGLFAENVVGLWAHCLDPVGNLITSDYNGNSYLNGTFLSFDSRRSYPTAPSSQPTPAPPAAPPPVICSLPAAVDLSLVMLDSKSAARVGNSQMTEIQRLIRNPALPSDKQVGDGDVFVTQALGDSKLQGISAGMHAYHVRIYLQNSK